MMICNEARDRLEAYAIGALEPDEHRLLELHLEGCATCRQEAERLLATAHLLPLMLATRSHARPSDSLKDRLLDTIATMTDSQETGVANESPEPASPVSERDSTRGSDRSANRPPDRIHLWNFRTLAAAAAIVLAVVSLILGVQLSQALDREEALQRQVDQVYARQQEIVLEVVDSNQTQRMVMLPLDDESTAYGKVFTRPDLPHVVAMSARLPEPPDGQRYHLWLTESGKTSLAGILMLNDQGFGLLVFDADSDGPVYEEARLTLQAPGGDSPAGETILHWPNPDQ